MSAVREISVGLLGYGCVGAAVDRLLSERRDELAEGMLARMECGLALEEAVAEVRALGYADADPTDDLSGADAAAKVALLATLAFGIPVALDDVERSGVEGLSSADLARARASGRRLRLVGEASVADDEVAARVGLAELGEDESLARLAGADNEIRLDGDWFGSLSLTGRGAGGAATATAVVADLVALAREREACSHVAGLGSAVSVHRLEVQAA